MTLVEALQTPAVQGLLGRAAVYELLSLAFSYPDADWRDQVLASIEDISGHDTAEAMNLHEGLAALAEALAVESDDAIAVEHIRLFAGEVVCSPHETEYTRDAFAKARRLADIAGFYHAFGLKVAADKPGLPDFVATELEFMGFLAKKQAFAAVQGWDENEEICADAQRAFLESHLACWLPAFCAALSEVGSEFFQAAAALAVSFVTIDARLSDASPRPMIARSTLPEDAEAFTCGLADSAAELDEGESLIELMPLDGQPAGEVGEDVDAPGGGTR
jgi:putative dimethyl sulfoxide reductase chaperone